jgi:hypothetical protein
MMMKKRRHLRRPRASEEEEELRSQLAGTFNYICIEEVACRCLEWAKLAPEMARNVVTYGKLKREPFFTRSALFASSLCTTVEKRGSSTATMCRTSWWCPLSALGARRAAPGMSQRGCQRSRAVAQGEEGRGHGGDLRRRAWWTEVCRGWLWPELG